MNTAASERSSPTRRTTNRRLLLFGGIAGLCTNLALLMGIFVLAPSVSFITLTGIVGLLAGAFSLSLWEYLSISAQRDQMAERLRLGEQHLEDAVAGARALRVEHYFATGLGAEEAQNLVEVLFTEPAQILRATLREETDKDVHLLGAPAVAALHSFLAFAAGAILPLLPFLVFGRNIDAFAWSLLGSLAILAILGAFVGRTTHRNMFLAGGRQVFLGGAAALLTFIIGNLVGTIS